MFGLKIVRKEKESQSLILRSKLVDEFERSKEMEETIEQQKQTIEQLKNLESELTVANAMIDDYRERVKVFERKLNDRYYTIENGKEENKRFKDDKNKLVIELRDVKNELKTINDKHNEEIKIKCIEFNKKIKDIESRYDKEVDSAYTTSKESIIYQISNMIDNHKGNLSKAIVKEMLDRL